ncbi:hypothetical protein [Paraglaciecola marina]|uniref:hypothetical protein n=1 Tax=Paraglaciecola marina TaxID=2500157 RepID=UPI00105B8EDD|nr:hypothetical protein [Paraglaciecola marina]
MNDEQKEIKKYRQHLRSVAHFLMDYAEDDNYIQKLINNDDLLPVEKALRDMIEEMAFSRTRH